MFGKPAEYSINERRELKFVKCRYPRGNESEKKKKKFSTDEENFSFAAYTDRRGYYVIPLNFERVSPEPSRRISISDDRYLFVNEFFTTSFKIVYSVFD